jgi:hypothetical protein
LCTECEEWETKLSACMVEDPDDYICCYCFEAKANEDQDELSLMIINLFAEEERKNPKCRAKMRRVK